MEIHNGVDYQNKCIEKDMLKEFRRMLSDVLNPDHTDAILLKWLRAKNFDLRKSEQNYRENVIASQIHKMETLDDIWDVPEVIQKYEFANYLGYAKDGTPIHYVAMGRGDLRGEKSSKRQQPEKQFGGQTVALVAFVGCFFLLAMITQILLQKRFIMGLDTYDICKYCSVVMLQLLKRCRAQSKKLGKEINEVTFVADMEEFSLRQVLSAGVLELALDLFRMLQDHYPDIWKYVLIVNAPVYFYSFFNLLKPIMRFSLLKNIRVVSKEETPRVLLKYIDAEVLPAFLGGDLVDSQGDPMCSEFMKFGAPIPEKYYLKNLPPLLPTDEGAEEVWVSQRSCYNYPMVIHEADSIIRIEVRTEGGSIVGNLFFREFGSDPENTDLPSRNEYLEANKNKNNVISTGLSCHLQCHMSPINSYMFAPWPGIYIFSFDNSYNWLTSRKIIFRFRILPPSV